jgi:uncharacterized protein (TIGR00290 family)
MNDSERDTSQAGKKTLLSWSSGKDSAWALRKLRQDPSVDLVGLFCTVNRKFGRVAMHGVRVDLLRKQAERIALPLEIIEIPHPCENGEYEMAMSRFVTHAKKANIHHFAFGDIFLEDVRRYREERLRDSGIEPIFPLWGESTHELSREMISGGLRAVITCVDPKQTKETLVGREYDLDFLGSLPETADPCGENGEFHSFVYDGPMFQEKIEISVGDRVQRGGFSFVDLLPKEHREPTPETAPSR